LSQRANVAIEFVFTMDRQVIAIASWIARRTSGISRVAAACPVHPQISQIHADYFSGAALSAIRDPKSAIL